MTVGVGLADGVGVAGGPRARKSDRTTSLPSYLTMKDPLPPAVYRRAPLATLVNVPASADCVVTIGNVSVESGTKELVNRTVRVRLVLERPRRFSGGDHNRCPGGASDLDRKIR